MPAAGPEPQRWTAERLQADRAVAEERFRAERLEEGGRRFRELSDEAAADVDRILTATGDLRDLAAETFQQQPRAWGPLRYVCAPPISEEDLWTLVGGPKFKVSNGPKNSWKRLNREVGGKAEQWRAHSGGAQVVTGAVLAGVYDLASLTSAQDAGVVVLWQHGLRPLREFLDAVATAG